MSERKQLENCQELSEYRARCMSIFHAALKRIQQGVRREDGGTVIQLSRRQMMLIAEDAIEEVYPPTPILFYIEHWPGCKEAMELLNEHDIDFMACGLWHDPGKPHDDPVPSLEVGRRKYFGLDEIKRWVVEQQEKASEE